jgi:O-methyltransferase
MIAGYRIKGVVKEVALHVPRLRDLLGPRYLYLHTPAQLAYLCSCLEAVRDVPGSVVEVGCFRGDTTLFLNRHMTCEAIEKPYWAIDTFSGFRDEDLDVEVARGQHTVLYRGLFEVNNQRWFDYVMHRENLQRVRSVACDAGAFEFGAVAPIALCLIDVVLYQPVKRALPRIWDVLAPGGIVVVDDYRTDEDSGFSGAGRAYREFVEERGLEPRRVCDKYGLLVKEQDGAARA